MAIDINKQKEILLQQKEEIERDLNALGVKEGDGDWMVLPEDSEGSTADPNDDADITEDFEEKIARLNVLEAGLKQIEKALRAIENGTYGICEVSGEPIPEERLLANPSATTKAEYAQ